MHKQTHPKIFRLGRNHVVLESYDVEHFEIYKNTIMELTNLALPLLLYINIGTNCFLDKKDSGI